jgi:flagellar hook-associated protein FlgK
MENFENYFENFTLENKSKDLDEDLKKTVSMINQIDSQRFELNQSIIEVESLMKEWTTRVIYFDEPAS